MKLRRMAVASAMVIAPLLGTVMVPVVVHAAADTCTWTGAVNGSFSNGGNWTGCDNSGVPENGDSLLFDISTFSNLPNNDMTSMSFADISFTGSNGITFALTGNPFTVTGDIDSSTDQGSTISNPITFTGTSTITVTQDAGLTFSGTIGGSGSLTKSGAGYANMDGIFGLTGALTSNDGQMIIKTGSTDASFSSLTLGSTTDFRFDAFSLSGASNSFTLTKPITINGGTLYFPSSQSSASDVNVTGTLTLGADSYINASTNVTVHVQGPLTGSGVLKAAGNGKVLNESTNNTTNTPAGELAVSGSGAGADPVSTPATPKTPDTGFSLAAAHPLQTLLVTLFAGTAIAGVAYKTRKTTK